jgi:hypothetical protein
VQKQIQGQQHFTVDDFTVDAFIHYLSRSRVRGSHDPLALEEQPPISPVPPFNDNTGTTASIQHALDKARAEWFSQAMAEKTRLNSFGDRTDITLRISI